MKSNSFQYIGGGLISKGGGVGEGSIIGSIFCLQVDEFIITWGAFDWIWGGL